jgi:HTH-type transcriptional regulator/antitoxin HigA
VITNQRQYKISKAALAKLGTHIDSLPKAKTTVGARFAKAELDALESERQILVEQLAQYEALRAAKGAVLEVDRLEDLPTALVKARIAQGLSQRALAERLRMKEQQIQRYEAEKYGSASLRRILEIANSLNLKLADAVRLQAGEDRVEFPAHGINLDFDKFPVKEMYRRGWFQGFAGSLQEAESKAHRLLQTFLSCLGPDHAEALHKMHIRAGGVLDTYALLAWKARIVQLANRRAHSGIYTPNVITTDWFRTLASLSAKPNGPRLAVEYLAEAGITLVVEPHLQRTYLDGAALLANKTPVIGMTLRYDRLDNFWFVLFHELAHLALHLRREDESKTFFDDLEAQPDTVENEADEFASNALLPAAIWEKSVTRFFRTDKNIRNLASTLSVSPAVIAGRIRNESGNYLILGELIGAAEVRKHFQEVRFGQ